MPYLPSEAAKKSQKYDNIINGDTREYQSEINDLKDKQQVSASIDANSPLRDEDGVLVSFESATPGISLEEDFEEVRLENKQFFFTGQIDNEFTFYFQPIATDDTTETETTTEVTTEEVEFTLELRDLLIQFVNEYFSEEFTPEVSTDMLHNRLLQFFDENRKKGENAQGWEEFRLNKKRKAAGISGKRYKSIKNDLRDVQYDEIIENHIYRTPEGQRIWLKLGFPYIEDQSPGKNS
jgi:hypothetical protein|tara:strand:+ start:1205 stop:1915 length:711 start_codon:yes stop_codon:yes gene_type:complete